MLIDVTKIILVMNERRRNFRTETKNIEKIQMKIIEYQHTTKIHWMDLEMKKERVNKLEDRSTKIIWRRNKNKDERRSRKEKEEGEREAAAAAKRSEGTISKVRIPVVEDITGNKRYLKK